MKAYILRRLLLIIPTLFGIMLLNFVIIQAAPGGPVEQLVMQLEGKASSATASIGSEGMEVSKANIYRGRRGLDPELIKQIEKLYGFDKPPLERFKDMVINYATFNFGTSFYQDKSVIQLIKEKLPVTISLNLWTTLLVYLISIPLGIKKAVRDGSKFDFWSSVLIIIFYAIPSFLFAILLILLFAGDSYWNIFPLRGLASDNMSTVPWYYPQAIGDYFWHLVLPVTALVIGSFASLTILTKNSFLEEINKQYVITARAKGLTENRVLYGHIFRNSMLIVISGFPAALIGILFTGSLLIEVIFSLDGIGRLSYEAVVSRNYPVLFGTLYIFSLIALLVTIIRDITYSIVDPRIDFGRN